MATKFNVKHQGKDNHHPPSTIYKWPLSDLPMSTLCPSLSLSFTIMIYISVSCVHCAEVLTPAAGTCPRDCTRWYPWTGLIGTWLEIASVRQNCPKWPTGTRLQEVRFVASLWPRWIIREAIIKKGFPNLVWTLVIYCLCLTASSDRLLWQLALTACSDSLLWQLALTASSDSLLWQLASYQLATNWLKL